MIDNVASKKPRTTRTSISSQEAQAMLKDDESGGVYVHEATVQNFKKSLKAKDESGYYVLGDRRVIPTVHVVQASTLDEPFAVKDFWDGRPLMIVSELERSRSVFEASSKEATHLRDVVRKEAREELEQRGIAQIQLGCNSRERLDGPSVHAVVTDEEYERYEEVKAFTSCKLLREYADNEKYSSWFDSLQWMCSKMSEIFQKIATKVEVDWRTMISEQTLMWWAAEDILEECDHPPTDDKHNLDPSRFCLRTSVTFGRGTDHVTGGHRDTYNISSRFLGLMDDHLSMSQSDNIGVVVYIPMPNDLLKPILVPQELWALCWFWARLFWHESMHIGTYLREMNKYAQELGRTERNEILPKWDAPVPDENGRLFAAAYSKRSLAIQYEIWKAYQIVEEKPRSCVFERGMGSNVVLNDFLERAVRVPDWEKYADCGCMSISEMQQVQASDYDGIPASWKGLGKPYEV